VYGDGTQCGMGGGSHRLDGKLEGVHTHHPWTMAHPLVVRRASDRDAELTGAVDSAGAQR
jgi:hypothetical protein